MSDYDKLRDIIRATRVPPSGSTGALEAIAKILARKDAEEPVAEPEPTPEPEAEAEPTRKEKRSRDRLERSSRDRSE